MQASIPTSFNAAGSVAAHGTPRRTVRGNFVMLRADSLRLILPQEDVKSTDYLPQKPVEFDADASLLYIPDAADGAVYVAISPEMRLLHHCPPDCFVSTSLQGLDVRWCWSEVRVLINAELHTEALPPVVLTPFSPLREIVALGDEWAFMCTADALQQFALAQGGESA